MNRTRALTLSAAAVLLLGFLRFALGEDILERVRRLRDQTHYDLASQLLEDHVKHGTPLSRELRWLQAELETDPERFDRMAASLTSGGSVSDSLNQVISLARAREYFARGRYLSAAEFLEALPPKHRDDCLRSRSFPGWRKRRPETRARPGRGYCSWKPEVPAIRWPRCCWPTWVCAAAT